MKRKIVIVTLIMCMSLSVAGCGESKDEVSKEPTTKIEATEEPTAEPTEEPVTAEPTPEESENSVNEEVFNIDIEKCIEDLKEGLPLDPDYTFVKDYTIIANDKDLTISIVVDDATDPERALDFADTIVRQLNLYANMQDSDIELGNKDFYGGLYTEYSALVGVAPYSKINNPDEWFVYDAIVGGKTMLNLK